MSPIQSRVLPLSPSLCYITILCQTRWHYTYLIQHLHYSIDQVIRENQTRLQPPDVWPRVNCIVCSHNRPAHTLLDYHICSPGQALPADTVQFTQQRRPPAYTLAPYRIYTLACTYAPTEATLRNRKGIASCSSRRTVAPTPTVARGMTRRGVPLTHSPQPKPSATLKNSFQSFVCSTQEKNSRHTPPHFFAVVF